MKSLRKTTWLLGLIAVFGLMTFIHGQTKQVWHLTVESRDDMGETAEKFKADLKEAFEANGDEVVDEASKESTDLNFYLGKDDDDDDNDGAVDDKDVSDGNGDGIVNEQDMADVYDLDEEIPDVMKGYPDNEKDEGIYIYLEKETGLAMVFISKVDSLKENGVATLSGNGFFQNASFQRRNSFMVDKSVANQVVKTVDKTNGTRIYVGNLSFSTTDQALRDTLSGISGFKNVNRGVDPETNRPKSFAYVTMVSSLAARNAIGSLNGVMLDGRPLIVQEAEEHTTGGEEGKGGGGRSRSSFGGRGGR
ncbi:MAG TPA: RNA-binding protein [Pyrinomonadaceae bacterium]|nr:RNA-binding protein [Pyrinomonadaceae bacterium]